MQPDLFEAYLIVWFYLNASRDSHIRWVSHSHKMVCSGVNIGNFTVNICICGLECAENCSITLSDLE